MVKTLTFTISATAHTLTINSKGGHFLSFGTSCILSSKSGNLNLLTEMSRKNDRILKNSTKIYERDVANTN